MKMKKLQVSDDKCDYVEVDTGRFGYATRYPKHKEFVCYLDIKKLEQIARDPKYANNKISVGTIIDWHNSERTVNNIDKILTGEIEVITHSVYDKFIIKIFDNEMNEIESIDCNLEVPKKFSDACYYSGVIIGKNLTKWYAGGYCLYEKLHSWNYEMREEFTKKTKELVAKYDKIMKDKKKYFPEKTISTKEQDE